MPFIAATFHLETANQKVLPTSIYLVGYVFGPLIFAPMSEAYGRRPITLYAFSVFGLSTLCVALAPNWPIFITFRLLAGISASSPISVVGGIYVDIFETPLARGRAVAVFFSVRRSKHTAVRPVLI